MWLWETGRERVEVAGSMESTLALSGSVRVHSILYTPADLSQSIPHSKETDAPGVKLPIFASYFTLQ